MAPSKAARPKVVLYNPTAEFYTMPLALLAVGSELDPERYRVVVVDGRLEDDPGAAIERETADALCLGVTVLTGEPIRDAVEISRRAKAARPDLPVVWGGWHPSMFGRECLEEPAVDATVQGQGEATFVDIVERLERGFSLSGCAGSTYRTPEGEIRVNPPRPLADINTFRAHDYTLIDVPRYYELKGKRQLDYVSSQGCAFRCNFCADPFVYERKWVGFAPERIVSEVAALWERYRFDDLNFQDETYFTYARRVEAVADGFLERGLPISWAGTLRADQCVRLSEEVFAKCRRSGLRRVLVGVESGSQEMIDRIQKDIQIEQVFATAERCREHGVGVIFPFIVGFPGESDASIEATIDVAKRLKAMSPGFETPIFYFKPYPGSAITEEAVADGFALPCDLDEWAGFDFVGSRGPWVSDAKYRLIERFKFYQELAWGGAGAWRRPLRRLARWRLEHDRYGFAVEKTVADWLRPAHGLS